MITINKENKKMIADIMSSKNFKAIIKELFIRYGKLNISIVFITQSYFRTPQDARLSSTHYVIMKIQSKKERITKHCTRKSRRHRF